MSMPLAWELTQELKRWLTPRKLAELNGVWRAQGLGYSDDAIATLAANLVAEGMSYEHIIGNLEVHRFRTSDHAYHGLLGFLSEIIYALLKERHVRNIDMIERSIQYLDGIASLAALNNPLWVFSLNHDLVIECFSAYSGIPLKAGYSEEKLVLPRYDAAGVQVGRIGNPSCAQTTNGAWTARSFLTWPAGHQFAEDSWGRWTSSRSTTDRIC